MSQAPGLREDVLHPTITHDMGGALSKQAPAPATSTTEPTVTLAVPAAADSLLSAGDAGHNAAIVKTPPGAKETMPAAPSVPAPFIPTRHILPQIPTMSHSRLAISKASSRKQVLKLTQPFFSLLEITVCWVYVGCVNRLHGALLIYKLLSGCKLMERLLFRVFTVIVFH